METPTQAEVSDQAAAPEITIIALFEDRIDAEQALVALRKANQTADRVSLIVRNPGGDQQTDVADVARDVVAAALGTVAQWLMGLAELVVSDRGRYLVAGPMGVALTGLEQGTRDEQEPAAPRPSTDSPGHDSMSGVLTRFGFSPKQAEYVEHRLSAGATLIGATLPGRADYDRVYDLFGDHDAVYIDVADTNPALVQAAGAKLAAGPGSTLSDDFAVIDVAARLRAAVEEDSGVGWVALRGQRVECHDGRDAGEIDLVLVEQSGVAGDMMAESLTPRYVVIGSGGLLGIGRRRTAVPVGLLDLRSEPILLRVGSEPLARAPEYDEDVPLGRREEERIFRYFGATPYWVAPDNADVNPASSERGEHDSTGERDRSR